MSQIEPEQEQEFAEYHFAFDGDHNMPTRHNELGSVVGSYDANGKAVVEYDYKKLAVGSKRFVESHLHRRENNGVNKIKEIAALMPVTPSIVDRAIALFKSMLAKKKYRGYSINDLATACFYLACREKNAPRTIIEFEKASSISRKRIGSAIRLILTLTENKIAVPDLNPVSIIKRIMQEIPYEFDEYTRERVHRMAHELALKMLENDERLGKNPTSIAAVAVYLACKKHYPIVPMEAIAYASGVTSVTMRARIREFGANG